MKKYIAIIFNKEDNVETMKVFIDKNRAEKWIKENYLNWKNKITIVK